MSPVSSLVLEYFLRSGIDLFIEGLSNGPTSLLLLLIIVYYYYCLLLLLNMITLLLWSYLFYLWKVRYFEKVYI